MQQPRATSVGPVNTGLKICNSLAGDAQSITRTGPASQGNYRLASWLDRQADALLFQGRHQHAERLAHQAAALRQARAEVVNG